ncbi:MAG: Origin recognition complex, subunit 1 [Vezdaea aestivalis]|nr:MAG: Origin recognition complex, subunit 1 [Vezdaea aestivalis]
MARISQNAPSEQIKPPPKKRGRKAKKVEPQQGGGVQREDSDDELGDEDLLWEWIEGLYPYDDPREAAQRMYTIFEDGNEHWLGQTKTVGARMGKFSCYMGDSVLVKAEGTNEAYVGIICEFTADEDDRKCAEFMWYSTEQAIRPSAKKRTDSLPNELYICPAWDTNPLAAINGTATVLSHQAFLSKYPNAIVPRSDPDFGKVFVCRRGCNVRGPKYTEEFIWEEFYDKTESGLDRMMEIIEVQTAPIRRMKAPVRVKRGADEAFIDDDDLPRTPSKKLKSKKIETPTKSKLYTPSKPKTPTSKRSIIKKPLEFTPLGTRILSPAHLSASPFQVARNRLHVSSVPTSLPCREQEYSLVYSHLESAITEGSGACIYISGTPGTGKTATVREVVSQLNGLVLAEEMDDFVFVEINGMKVTDPHQSYSLLWEALRGERISPSHALEQLNQEFSTPSPRRVPCVVLMDELDQLVTRNQSVMYNFFNWPGLEHSRLIVLAVANTMDLPERTLSNKISSRLGLTRITFPGYTHTQLMEIIGSRLADVPSNLVDSDAIQFASRKVAAVTGDARRALDICRRAVEIAEAEARSAEDESGGGSLPPTPSKTPGRAKKAQQAKQQARRPNVKVTIATIKQAIHEATSSPMQLHLRSLSITAKLFLAGLLSKVRQTGLSDCIMGEVLDQARAIGKTADNEAVQRLLLAERVVARTLEEQREIGDIFAIPVPRVLGINKSAVELAEAGVVGLEAKKGERVGRVRLNIGVDELLLALREDTSSKGMGFVSI